MRKQKSLRSAVYDRLFYDFLLSGDSLRVYEKGELLYFSKKDKLIPWLEYIGMFSPYVTGTVIFDRLTGNASALLAVKAGCRQVYSPLGSRLACLTLDKYHVRYDFIQIVSYIRNDLGDDMCRLERLSLRKSPEEFYELVRNRLLISLKRTPGIVKRKSSV